MGKYRYDIGLGTKYMFGTELEFFGAYLIEVCAALKCKELPYRFALNHKSRGFTKYDEWYVDIDSTVTNKENNEFLGGEISSRILTDKKKIWLELKEVCDALKEVNAYCNENCGNHVRINLAPIKNERYFFEALSKLVALFEKEFRLFYMGDEYFIRSISFEKARSISYHLLNYINNVDFKDPNFLYTFRHNGITLFTRNDGINLQDYDNKKFMEIRYPNGTIKEKTIQNNINFSLKLVDAIDKEVFDLERLTSLIDKEKDDLLSYSLFSDNSFQNFEFIVNSIATSTEDRDDFVDQYERVLRTRPKL